MKIKKSIKSRIKRSIMAMYCRGYISAATVAWAFKTFDLSEA